MKHAIFFLLIFLFAAAPGNTSAPSDLPMDIRADFYALSDHSKPILLVLTITPHDGWHAYASTPGPTGIPTSLEAAINEQVADVRYPAGEMRPDPLEPELQVELYEGPTPLFIPLDTPPSSDFKLRLTALLCSSSTCRPVREEITGKTPATVNSLPPANKQSWWPVFAKAAVSHANSALVPDNSRTTTQDDNTVLRLTPRYFAPELEVHTLSKAAGLAFLAGLILNFMPCVLPVITLKLRSFIPTFDAVSANQRQAFRIHNIFFALGIVLYFFALAVIISITGMAWGQIFQQPAAIITLTGIVFALSLSLFGIYDLPLIDLKGGAKGVVHHPQLESLITGVLATILATPCSGPFLGGVLAWALIQPPEIIAAVLSCIGLGMAAPYLLMAAFPRMYRLLPTPGPWTQHLERFLGFLLAGTCVYLIGLLPTAMYLNVLILLWAIAVAAWIWGHWTHLRQSTTKRFTIRIASALFVAATALFLFLPTTETNPWKPFSMQQFSELRGKQNLVLDFTADWCPNCKFLEKTVLTPDRSSRLAKEYQAELLKVDLTAHDPELLALLGSLGSKSIPILAIFSKDNPDSPLVLRDLFTSGQLEQAMKAELR